VFFVKLQPETDNLSPKKPRAPPQAKAELEKKLEENI
jgi:hypothetical protein